MTAISYDKIKIISPWEIQSIYELSIKKTLNDHAELRISALLTEASGKKAALQEKAGEPVQIYIEDGAQQSWLFKGVLKLAKVSATTGLYTINAWFLSATSQLDDQQKSRSFQNTNLTYDQIVKQVLADYPNISCELTAAQKTIHGPIIQYRETDWQFIKRLSSYLETVIVPDVTLNERIFSFGYPSGGNKTLPEDINYATGKNLRAYWQAAEYNPNIAANQFAYYEVESYAALTIGDQVTFQTQEMYVSEVTIALENGLLVYRATLVKQTILRQDPIYNEKIQGVSLLGRVLALENQTVKLHLAIDQEQNTDEAYWYPFIPPTVDMMYLMPQLGTTAILLIPDPKEHNAFITGSLRTNGQSCANTGDPNTRYLATEYGQELKLTPGGIYITAGRDDLCLDFDDGEGVALTSHKNMLFDATEEIIIFSEKKVIFNAPSQILMATPKASISMENELHFRAQNINVDCTDETEFPPVEQPEPEKEVRYILRKPVKEEPGIDFTAIWTSVKGAVAVVGEFGVGFLDSVATNTTCMQIDESTRPDTIAYHAGRVVGDGVTFLGGCAGFLIGGTIAGGGITLGAVGAGPTLGGSVAVCTPAVVGGVALATYGTLVAGNSVTNVGKDINKLFSKISEPTGNKPASQKKNEVANDSNNKATTGAKGPPNKNAQNQLDDLYKGPSKPKGANNPVVKEAASKGRKRHKDYDCGPGVEKEKTLPSGKRMDGYDAESKTVHELKPNNPKAVQKGLKQLDGYVEEANEAYGSGHIGKLHTYDK